MPFTENLPEFAARMKCPSMSDGNEHVFANGAVSIHHRDGHVENNEPPDDPREKIPIQIRFWTLRSSAIATLFNHLKAELTGPGYTSLNRSFKWDRALLGSEPDDSDLSWYESGALKLKHIQQRHADCRAHIVTLREELDDLPEIQAERGAQQRRQEELRAMQEAERQQRSRVTSIELEH